MEIFEVHITGDDSIHRNAAKLKLHTIELDLITPDGEYLRTECMVSHTLSCKDFQECKGCVDEYARELEKLGTKITRIKIESPYYKHYIPQSLYIESHRTAVNTNLPVSWNIQKSYGMSTDREYDHDKFPEFMRKYDDLGATVELCLYDSNVKEDEDWFNLYKKEVEA